MNWADGTVDWTGGRCSGLGERRFELDLTVSALGWTKDAVYLTSGCKSAAEVAADIPVVQVGTGVS